MRLRPLALPPLLALAVALAGCAADSSTVGTNADPSVGPLPTGLIGPPAPASVPPASPSGGKDNIGGTVSKNLGSKPAITVPGGPRPTKLLTEDVVEGKGQVAGATGSVTVQYVGVRYADGKQFDSSWDRGQPATFPLNGVIPGFAQGITGMKVGGRREIVIPAELGYGQQGAGADIPPDTDLVFVVDLLAVS